MEILRYTAFSSDPSGGNPAGVVLDATGVDEVDMLAMAAEVGFSETAFLAPRGDNTFDVRYFSPIVEVPFCGHATIAAAVAHAERYGPGSLVFMTPAGRIDVVTKALPEGPTATLVSVPPRTVAIAAGDVTALLAALDWSIDDLDPAMPVRAAFAGLWHPIIAVRSRARLADLRYDFPALRALLAIRGWTTVDLLWRESESVFYSRNPFPPGGVVEDPATGAAAAALGGYLRDLHLVELPATITIRQGDDMGRPGVITVGIGAESGTGLAVTGRAVAMS